MATFQYNYVFTLMKVVVYLSLSSLLLLPWKRSHALGYIKFDLTLITGVFYRPYAAQIFLGVPAQKMFLAIDMDSDLVWFPCGIKGGETMPPAGTQKDTMPPGDDITGSGLPGLIYNVNESSTFLHVFCNDKGLCPPRFQETRPGNCSSETYCTLPSDKPDRSNNMYLSTDILNSTNGIDFFNFLFACDPYDIYESTVSTRGVLGLGRREPSFFQEFGHMYDYCLSYCLPNLDDSTSTGYLAFGLQNGKCPGDDDMSSLVVTDLSVHPNYPSSYLIHITSITVNTTQISINSSSDQSGIIVNPATFFTTLPMGLYQAMRDEFKEQNNSTVVDVYGAYVNGGMLDLCFNTSEGAAAINIPRVSMTFANDATVELDGEHGIIYVYDSIKSCLGFMGNEDPHAPGVLGGMQQAKLKVGIDVANQKVGFRRKSSCS